MRRLIYFVLAFVIWVTFTWPVVDGRVDMQVVVAGLVDGLLAPRVLPLCGQARAVLPFV